MNERLRWGILGANSWIAGEAIAPSIRRSRNGRLVALASRKLTAPVNAPEGVRVVSYEALLDDPEVDAVYIPLPNSMHLEWAVRAAEAGKPVLCEKPLAPTYHEAARIVAAFERRGVPLMEGLMYRFHPQHRRVLALVASGAIGEIVEVRAHLSVDIMNPPDPSNVRLKPELGGGALLDMGCYTISVARMVYGVEPVAVRGWWKIDDRFAVDVAAGGVLEFPGARMALVSCSFEGFGNGFYSAIGRKGVIEAPRAIIQGLGTRLGEALIITMDADGRRSEETIASLDHYQLIVEAFADAVLNKSSVPLPPSDSLANMRVLDAFATSAREGREVRL
ncbi:MAG TPA: Gfo/Idh/MocA family oxidoreductase [Roseiarcus sp.]|nr:Gfo/Idh/MocA family oxidoreductase [Roseiarcus sp.]